MNTLTNRYWMLALCAAVGAASASNAVDPSQARLQGAETSTLNVQIQKIDDGPILISKRHRLDTKADVAPGLHHVHVLCLFRFSWGIQGLPGEVDLEAVAGHTYYLTGVAMPEGDKCKVDVSDKP